MSVRYTAIITAAAFVLHLVWENAQAPLYAGYQSFSAHFPLCLMGAAGDVAVTLFVLAFMLLLKREIPQTARDFIALAVIGFGIAVLIEQRALLSGAWGYAPAMPLLPILQVGLTPILQMTILLPLSFYLAAYMNQSDKKFS